MFILETPRLILRDFEMDDLDALYDLVYADPRVKDTWSRAPGTPEMVKKKFAENYIQPQSRWGLKAILLKPTATLIGLMGFQVYEPSPAEEIPYLLTASAPQRTVNFDPNCLEVELTYALGHAYWKQGYATEMGRALIAYGFASMGIGRIIQGVLAYNANSIELMRRLGFQVEPGLHSEDVVGVLDRV